MQTQLQLSPNVTTMLKLDQATGHAAAGRLLLAASVQTGFPRSGGAEALPKQHALQGLPRMYWSPEPGIPACGVAKATNFKRPFLLQ